MDFQYYLNILLRRKWLILAVMFITSGITYYIVKQLPNTYRTSATLSTGIVSLTGIEMDKSTPFVQEYMIEKGYSNLLELVNSERALIFLTHQLLIHDLGRQGVNVDPPFRSIKDKEDLGFSYTQEEVNNLLEIMKSNLDSLDASFSEIENQLMFEQLASAYGYDYKTLIEQHFTGRRKGESDLLEISFISENPKLSYYAVNKYLEHFLRLDRFLKLDKENTIASFYREQAKEKKRTLDQKVSELNSYKSNRSILDLNTMSTTMVDQIRQIEAQRESVAALIPALKKNIVTINSYLGENGQSDASSKVQKVTNSELITALDEQINKLTILSLEAEGKDEQIERRLRATKKRRDNEVRKLTGFDANDKRDEENQEDKLINQRIEQELDLNEAEQSLQAYDEELAKLRARANNMVSDEAYLANLEKEIEILRGEYEPLARKLYEAQIELQNDYQPLKPFQLAKLPEEPEPKHSIVVSVFAGIVAAAFTMMIVLLMSLLDYTLQSPHQFKKFVKLPLLGTVNKVKVKNLDLQYLFNSNGHNDKLESFRESLRNLRFAIEDSGGSRFLFTSPKENEGKTFMIITLAHALTIKGKKVLIVDTNFKNNTLTRMSKKGMEANKLTTQLIGDSDLDEEFISQNIHSNFNMENIDIIGNRGTYQSPSEVFAGKQFSGFIERLASNYDYIFFESASLNRYSDTKELIEYVDGVIAVFSAESEFKTADKNSISYLKSLGSKYLGSILNKVELKHMA